MTKPLKPTWLAPYRMLRNWGEKAFMVVTIVVIGIGLSRLQFPATWPSGGLESTERGGSGLIVEHETLHVWLPPIFIALAATSANSVAPTHQELRSFLERRGQQNLWYAVTIRGHQVNGGMADITFIRYPYREAENFWEFREILARAAGDSTSQDSGPKLHILPGEPPERAPRGPRAVARSTVTLSEPEQEAGFARIRGVDLAGRGTRKTQAGLTSRA